MVRMWSAFNFFTYTCASRQNLVHFFDISTSKKRSEREVLLIFSLTSVLRTKTARTFSTSQLPKMVRTWGVFNFFNLFHLHMCFSPKRRALFRHLNFQKWSEREVLLAFSLANVLRASTACTFSSLIWPDGSAPTAFASLLFDPPEPQIIGKTQCFATFLPFRASASSFFWLFSSLIFSLLLFSSLSISAFHLSILSEVWLPNLLRLYMYMYNIYIICVCVWYATAVVLWCPFCSNRLDTLDPWPALFVVSCASAGDHDNAHNGNVQHFNVLQNFGDFDKSGNIWQHLATSGNIEILYASLCLNRALGSHTSVKTLKYKISSDILVLWKL